MRDPRPVPAAVRGRRRALVQRVVGNGNCVPGSAGDGASGGNGLFGMGAGGGGYFGGGAGAFNALGGSPASGGGGGSDFPDLAHLPAGVGALTVEHGVRTGNGLITISYTANSTASPGQGPEVQEAPQEAEAPAAGARQGEARGEALDGPGQHRGHSEAPQEARLLSLNPIAALDEKQLSALHGKQYSAGDTASAMSQENVELMRRAYEFFNEGGPDALISAGMWSPEVMFDFSPSEIPGLGVYRGRDEVRAFFEEDWFGAFPFEEWGGGAR